MTISLTDLEAKLLEELYKSSAGNGHDFGFTEDGIGIVGKKQLGGVISSLVQKGIIDVDSEGVTTDSGHWHQFEFCLGVSSGVGRGTEAAAAVRKLLDERTESFSAKASRIADEHKLHPVDAALLADVIEPSTDAYLVVVSRGDEVLDLMVVEATAARFARRAARAEFAHGDKTGLSFNARRM